MNDSDLAALRRFLFEHVTTYEELEILLLLQRNAQSEWAAAALATELGLPADTCHQALVHLSDHGLLEPIRGTQSFRYGPARDDLARRVDELERRYRDAHVAVIKMMSANAVERVRTATIRSFADAFRVRAKK